MKIYLSKLNQARKDFLSTFRSDKVVHDLQKKLADLNQKFEILSKATNDAIRDCNMQNNQITWNHGLKTIFGYDEQKSDHDHLTWIANLHPDDKDEVMKSFTESLNNGKSNWNAIYRYRCSNGKYKYTFDRSYIVYEGLKATRMIGTMQDIDERMTTLAEVEKLSLVASKTETLVVITDADEKIEWVNEGFVKRTGYPLHDVIGKRSEFLQGPDTDRATIERILAKKQASESVTEEILNYTSDGKKFWLKMNINPVFNNDNKVIRSVTVGTDITEQKNYENKLTSLAGELSDLIENANAIIVGVDNDGCVNEWNKQAIITTGYDKADIFGKKLTDFVIGHERQQNVEISIKHVLEGNLISLKEFQVINQNGDTGILLLSATPRKNSSGEIVGLMAVGQDITELSHYRNSLEEKVKERTQALKAALEKEKELVDLKSKFVSIASHEFRTPLSTISLVSSLLKKHREKFSPDEFNLKLETIQKQVLHMTNLLDDILIIGKGDAGKITTQVGPVCLSEFFMQTARDVEQSHETYQIIVCLNSSVSTVSIDVTLLRKIVSNLLTNALKFSNCPVELVITCTTDSLQFHVIDKGIGIPPGEIDSIFSTFHRASNVGAIQGTGLGLSIVKKSIELLKGEISITSTLGKGTTFQVNLPLAS